MQQQELKDQQIENYYVSGQQGYDLDKYFLEKFETINLKSPCFPTNIHHHNNILNIAGHNKLLMKTSSNKIQNHQIQNQINIFPSFQEIDLMPASLLNGNRNTSSDAEIYLKNKNKELLSFFKRIGDTEMQLRQYPTFDEKQMTGIIQTMKNQFDKLSKKVFIGGLPPDITENQIMLQFQKFGDLVVDWPHKNELQSERPPKGYAFLIFYDESSVWRLCSHCFVEEDNLKFAVSSGMVPYKKVQIRPWNTIHEEYNFDLKEKSGRLTVFVGGVPRPLRAAELALEMERKFGNVCYAAIDVDQDLKYPKGAGRVTFSDQTSYVAALSAKFVQFQTGGHLKKVEIKAFYLDNQLCDICLFHMAKAFCEIRTCLKYYCEICWKRTHSNPGTVTHKPVTKEDTLVKTKTRSC